MKDCKVNVLGTEYNIIYRKHEDEKRLKKGSDGTIDVSIKEIIVAIFEADDSSMQDLEDYQKRVTRHELTHAFLYESGLWDNSHGIDSWGSDEEITDWFAIQSPKIYRVFYELGIL